MRDPQTVSERVRKLLFFFSRNVLDRKEMSKTEFLNMVKDGDLSDSERKDLKTMLAPLLRAR